MKLKTQRRSVAVVKEDVELVGVTVEELVVRARWRQKILAGDPCRGQPEGEEEVCFKPKRSNIPERNLQSFRVKLVCEG